MGGKRKTGKKGRAGVDGGGLLRVVLIGRGRQGMQGTSAKDEAELLATCQEHR